MSCSFNCLYGHCSKVLVLASLQQRRIFVLLLRMFWGCFCGKSLHSVHPLIIGAIRFNCSLFVPSELLKHSYVAHPAEPIWCLLEHKHVCTEQNRVYHCWKCYWLFADHSCRAMPPLYHTALQIFLHCFQFPVKCWSVRVRHRLTVLVVLQPKQFDIAVTHIEGCLLLEGRHSFQHCCFDISWRPGTGRRALSLTFLSLPSVSCGVWVQG